MMNFHPAFFNGNWDSWMYGSLGFFGILMPIIGLALLALQIYMLVDAIRHEKENKLIWVLVILFINPIGALLYYFMEMKKRGPHGNK